MKQENVALKQGVDDDVEKRMKVKRRNNVVIQKMEIDLSRRISNRRKNI